MTYLLVVLKANDCRSCKDLTTAWPTFLSEIKLLVPEFISDIQCEEIILPTTKSEIPSLYPKALSKFRSRFPTLLLVPIDEWEKATKQNNYEFTDTVKVFGGLINARGGLEYKGITQLSPKTVALWVQQTIGQKIPKSTQKINEKPKVEDITIGVCSVTVKNRTYT